MISGFKATVNEELDMLEKSGRLKTKDVYEYAKDNVDSELHSRFIWDTEKAAYEHNLEIARDLIQNYTWRYVAQDNNPVETRKWVSIKSDRGENGGYRRIEDVLKSIPLRNKLLEQARHDFDEWKRRYIVLEKELSPVFRAMDRVK